MFLQHMFFVVEINNMINQKVNGDLHIFVNIKFEDNS